MEQWKKEHAPVYDFVTEDEIGHRVWVIDGDGETESVSYTHLDVYKRQAPVFRICFLSALLYLSDILYDLPEFVPTLMKYKTQADNFLLYTSRCV